MLRATKNIHLTALILNVYPGDNEIFTVWNDQVQKMTLPDGTAKGMKMVLQERVNVVGMNAEKMRQKLKEYSDFSEHTVSKYH